MAAPSSDSGPLLNGGLLIASAATVMGLACSAVTGSAIMTVLTLDFAFVAAAAWSARQFALRRRLLLSQVDGKTPTNTANDLQVLHALVQTQTAVLGGLAAVVGLMAGLQLLQLTPADLQMVDETVVLGLVCLAGAFVWIVLARSFQSLIDSDLLEASSLMLAFREAQWFSLIAAAGFIGATIDPNALVWTTRALLTWLFFVCAESLFRAVGTFLIPTDPSWSEAAPIHSLLRECLFTASNPAASLVRTFERRFGVSVRSSWAIRFIRNATLPLLAFLMILCWGLTSLGIVETHQMAVREHFGKVVGDPLGPGLHLMLPWPFGRIRSFPVKIVQQLPIGYVETDENQNRQQPRALLWTKPHAKEEFALALGDGSEMVAVNAIVYYKVAENRDEFLDYVFQQSSAAEALTAFAYRALMEQTQGRTLDDVLSVNRAAFAREVAESVRRRAKSARLGLEIVDFALLNLHPPIEAGAEYLEVINARLDARRRVTEAQGERDATLLDAQTRSGMSVAVAKVVGSRREAAALSEVAEFSYLARAFTSPPQTFRLRLWMEAVETALTNQRLFVVEHQLLDEGGGILLDTRPLEARRLPELNAPSPDLLPGQNAND